MSGEMNRRGFIKGAGAAPRTLDATALVDTLKGQGAFLG